MKHPFSPTFGDVPQIFLKDNSNDELYKIIEMIKNSDYARSIFITGVRGVGKTSLMMSVSEYFEQDSDYYIVDLINKEGIANSLVRLLANQVDTQLQKSLKSISTFSIDSPLGGVSVSKQNELPNIDVTLDRLMAGIKKRNKRVLVTIDEVDNSKPIKEFIQIFSSLKRKKYPIYLVMTGLPDLVLNLQNDDKLTFLLRSDKIVVKPLQKLDILNTYSKIFKCEVITATRMAKMTRGYSYAFQLLGYLLFDRMQGKKPTMSDVDAIKQDYQNYLYNNAYQKIFSELSEMDQKYLYAVCGNHKLDEVAKIMKKSNVFVAQYRRRALERNLIVPAKLGYVTFTLPYFENYLDETKNVDSIFYLGLDTEY